MHAPTRWLWSAALALAGLLMGDAPAALGTARPAPIAFTVLDDGGAVVPHVLVTALTVTSRGSIYAAGVYTIPNPAPYANRPIDLLGSVWLVSNDHGATWIQHVSTTDPHAFPKTGVAPWRDHHALPIDFTPAGITVDSLNPRVIYVAGCTDSGGRCADPLGGPVVVRSIDGGQTWQNSLSLATIVKTPALRAAYHFGGAIPTQGYAVIVDPRNSRHLYAAVSGLGVLRSWDAGQAWTYATQPQTNQTTRPCELLLDPHNPNILYELNRAGALYRTTDAGAHWAVRAPLNRIVGGSSASLAFVGRTLYVTAAKGLYASIDGGSYWRLISPVPLPGAFYQSVRSVGGWISAFGPKSTGPAVGLYAMRDGHGWHPVANTEKRGPQNYGSLDLQAMDGNLVTRVWEDHAVRVIFTSAPLGGLYRWQGNL